MKRILPSFFALVLIFSLFAPMGAIAEMDEWLEDDTQVYTLQTESGEVLMQRAGRIYLDDEYISGDNMLYRVSAVDDASHTATAKLIGEEPFDDSVTAFAIAETEKKKDHAADSSDNKLICMYSTHSDESYVPSDGTSSKLEDAGIYDVGDALKENFEKLGIEVDYSKETHLPHDAGAYRRSRRTAEELLKAQPAAILDIHRDGIPNKKEYDKTVEGEDITQVRLLVGRSNPNAASNRSFAKTIKKTADKEYPGLIKDIFIGKGNYNQELFPRSILLEFGTHVTDKEKAIKSTEYIANVLNGVLFDGSAKAESPEAAAADKKEENSSAGSGIAWFIGIAILAVIVYALVATGSFKTASEKIGRGASEMTGGIIGKKPDKKDKK